MALALPSARLRVRSNRAVFAPVSRIHSVVGPCSKGPYTPTRVADVDALTSTFGFGPAVKALAYEMGRTGAPGIMRRIDPTTQLAEVGDVVPGEGATVPAITGTPNDHYQVMWETTTPGELNAAQGRYSLNGGATWSTPATVPSGGAVVLGSSGLTATYSTATGNDVAGSWTLEAFPASQAVLPVVATRVGSSTSVVTITGTPLDAYEIVLEALTGGTIGTAGIVARYSLDGGRTYTKRIRLGTATTLQINDGTEDSGLDFSFAAGTLETGDEFASGTTEPAIAASDVVEALDELDAMAVNWRFCHVVGAVDAPAAGTIGAEFTAFAADELSNARFAWALMSARDRRRLETETAWENALVDDFDALENARVAVGGGYVRITCPLTRRRNRRPVAWLAVPELLRRPIEEDLGRKASGALSSDVAIYEDGERIEHDARVSQTLQGARFLTLRTFKRSGDSVFFTRGSTFDAEGGLEGYIARRQVLDVASDIFAQVLEEQLMDGVEVNAADEENPGAITEANAARIDREVETAIRRQLEGKFSALSVRTSRTTVLAAGVRLPCKVSIVGLEYLEQLDGDIGFVTPELVQLAA
ncbi:MULTISPECIES: DUF2586 family protein [Sorangium]|uniref:Uncharacterized protein n=1 Tax=Sorangium cellulosum TaxID=56 RepID=A0A4V0NGH2_SORCE|nr:MULTISPECIES: DUF2586 family protein [Sorangium]AUX33162.1 uncharacterized protein SOCE836_053160 [Sorangium cellulosum]AUX33219.1 uncharacterized protein SOCE836_053730 [Sorangium cellulosum]WCQ92538.1 tail sheath [Sorangium sp. Soce836]